MKIVRYLDSLQQPSFGRLINGQIERLVGDLFSELHGTGEFVEIGKLLAPLTPSGILGVGLNYKEHARESGMPAPQVPVIFFKGLNTLQHPGEPITIPTALASHEVDYECELAVVIGRACKNVRRANALDYVLGYTCANDVSARDWQLRSGGGQWCRGKSFDSFCPLGPCLVTADEMPNPNALRLQTILNGDIVQDSSTKDMIFDVPALIEFLSGSTTLLPGTVILTGTPQGVGMATRPPRWLRLGDSVTIEIEGIGSLTNPVILESQT